MRQAGPGAFQRGIGAAHRQIPLAGKLFGHPVDLLGLRQNLFGRFQKQLPFLRQLNTGIFPPEQLIMQLFLQAFHRSAETGLGDIQVLSRLVDGPTATDLHHIAEMLDVHVLHLLCLHYIISQVFAIFWTFFGCFLYISDMLSSFPITTMFSPCYNLPIESVDAA